MIEDKKPVEPAPDAPAPKKAKAGKPEEQEIIKPPNSVPVDELLDLFRKAQSKNVLDDVLRKDFLIVGLEITDSKNKVPQTVRR